ncbi:MAG: nucleotide exchange factor GrpE [Chloroflexi bacterium]|nr:MAG: nucleotide exchange factor GrpE [Chloroflexota bacterium]
MSSHKKKNSNSIQEIEEMATQPETESLAGAARPEAESWRDLALRLQAERLTYRRRQQQYTEERITEEQNRLLREFLEVADNLEEALSHIERDDPLYRGVQITYDSLCNLLHREGVEPFSAVGQPFDPQYHAAVALVPAPPTQEEELVVIAEEQRGYQRGEQLLRPARVIVAQREQAA